MKHRSDFLIPIMLLLISSIAHAQSSWKMKLENDGIKVYTKNIPGSSVKAIRAEVELETTLDALATLLLDVNGSKEWIYATKKVALLQQVSPTEVIYYSEVALPWPINNRDFIVDFSITQDSVTKTLKAVSVNKPDWLPRNKDMVRVEQSYSQWLITPMANGRLHVEYELQVDPGGCLPSWLVNMFATTGPYYTFQKLREQVKKPEYKNSDLACIRN